VSTQPRAGSGDVSIGDDPLVSTVSGHPQFLALCCPPTGGHLRIFNHVIVNYIIYIIVFYCCQNKLLAHLITVTINKIWQKRDFIAVCSKFAC